MAKISMGGKVLFEFPNLILDEFIPVIDLNKTKFETDFGYGFLGSDTNEFTLSSHIDEKMWKITPRVLTIGKRSFKLSFNLKKGSEKTSDLDGIVDTKLSVSDPEIKITSPTSFKTQYGETFEIELEIKKNTDAEFYIDFYANDDDDDFNKGELKDLHCGRMKVKFDYTVLTDWDTIPTVIPKNKFIEWGHPGVKKNCFNYALEQLKQVGHWVKSERWNKKWDGTKELNDHIYQLFLEQDVAGMKKGEQKNQFEPGVEYLKKTLKTGIPVLVGVDDASNVANDDMTTEHFITIVGMGEDLTGKYFLFYDNAVPENDIGTSDENKLYCNLNEFKIKGSGDIRNDYIQGSIKGEYTVTQIRETKWPGCYLYFFY